MKRKYIYIAIAFVAALCMLVALCIHFMPKDHKSAEQNVGTLEFDLRRNNPTIDIGYAVVEVSAYYPFFGKNIRQQTITQQICFDLAE